MKSLFLISLFIFTGTTVSAQSRIKAKMYADKAAKAVMNECTPISGENAYAVIHDYEFDRYSEEYLIEMTAVWDAMGCMLCSTKEHRVKGILIKNVRTGRSEFKPTYKNSAVRASENWSAATGIAIGAAIILSVD